MNTVCLAMLLTIGVITGAQAQTAAAGASRTTAGADTPPATGTAATPDTTPTTPTTRHQKSSVKSHWGEGSADGRSVDPATFVTEAAQSGLTEVAASKVAMASSENAAVKQFAARMVSDHTQANEELSSLARSKGLQMPTSLDPQHQAAVQELTRKRSADLDAAYVKQMKEDHARTVALFQAATRTSDPDLAAFAKKVLPTLQKHQHLAGALPGKDLR